MAEESRAVTGVVAGGGGVAGQVEEEVEEEEAGTKQEVEQEAADLRLGVVEVCGQCEPADGGDEVGGDEEEAVQPG